MLRVSHRRDGAVLAAHHLSTYMKAAQESKPKYLDEHTWYCDNCGLQGGMTIRIQQCPECYHHRCPDCRVERRRFNVFAEPKNSLDPIVRSPDLCKSGLLAKPPSSHPVNNDIGACPHLEVLYSRPTLSQSKSPQANLEKLNIRSPSVSSTGSSTRTLGIDIGMDSSCCTPSVAYLLSTSSTEKSRATSETFSVTEQYTDTDTEMESDFGESDEDSRDGEAGITATNHAVNLLEAHLFSVLFDDVELTTRLIAQIHNHVRLGYEMEDAGSNDTPKTTSTTGGLGISSSASSNILGMDSQPRRTHGRRAERNDEDGEDDRPKRPKRKIPTSPTPSSKFACPFHKKDAQKYNPLVNRMYRHCICPAPSELRHITYHFKSVHRPAQCERCYTIFKTVHELVKHRRHTESCPQGSASLKEGIDDSQWSDIMKLLKMKRGLSPSEKDQHEYDQWFGIWRIIFPDDTPPDNPWNENVYTRQIPSTNDIEQKVSSFEALIFQDIQEGRLLRNDDTHIRYMLALRTVLEGPDSRQGTNIEDTFPNNQLAGSFTLDTVRDNEFTSNSTVPNQLQDGFAHSRLFAEFHPRLLGGNNSNFGSPYQNLSGTPNSQGFESTPTDTSTNLSSRMTNISDFSPSAVASPNTLMPPLLSRSVINVDIRPPHEQQLDFDLEERYLSQEPQGELVAFNPTLRSDSTPLSFWNGDLEKYASDQSDGILLEGYAMDLVDDVDNEAMTAILDIENEMPEAMASWKTKLDGNMIARRCERRQ